MKSEESDEKKVPAILERIETLLGQKRWSRRELARQTGIDESTAQGWWQRKSSPGLEDAVGIARAFGTTVEYLVTGKDPEPPEPEYVCDEQGQLIDWIRGMSRDEVNRIWAAAAMSIQTLGLPAMKPLAVSKKEKVG